MIWCASMAKFNYEFTGSTARRLLQVCVCVCGNAYVGHVCVVEAARGRPVKCSKQFFFPILFKSKQLL